MNVAQCMFKPFLKIFLLPPLNPVSKTPSFCYTMATLQNNTATRLYFSVFVLQLKGYKPFYIYY